MIISRGLGEKSNVRLYFIGIAQMRVNLHHSEANPGRLIRWLIEFICGGTPREVTILLPSLGRKMHTPSWLGCVTLTLIPTLLLIVASHSISFLLFLSSLSLPAFSSSQFFIVIQLFIFHFFRYLCQVWYLLPLSCTLYCLRHPSYHPTEEFITTVIMYVYRRYLKNQDYRCTVASRNFGTPLGE